MLDRLKGEVVVVSGRPLLGGKKDVEDLLRAEGAKVGKSVTKRTTLLVACEGLGTGAAKKALALKKQGQNIEVIDERNLFEVLRPTQKELRQLLDSSRGREHLSKLFPTVVTLEGLSLRGAELGPELPSEWSVRRVDLRDARVDGIRFVEPREVDFRGAILSGGRVLRAQGCDFRKATLADVEVYGPTDCDFRGATLQETSFPGPSERCNFAKLSMPETELGALTECTFDGADLRGTTIGFIGGCSFVGANLSELWEPFSKTRMYDSDFRRADLSRMELDRPTFERCDFRKARFRDSNLAQPTFVDCKLAGADFAGALITGATFEGCDESKAKGLLQQELASGPSLKALSAAGKRAGAIDFDLLAHQGGKKARVRVWSSPISATVLVRRAGEKDWHLSSKDLASCLPAFAACCPDVVVDHTTLRLKSKKSPVKGKALKQLVLGALHESFDTDPSAPDGDGGAVDRHELREAILSELRAGDLRAFHRRDRAQVERAGPFRGADLAECELAGADLSKLDLRKGCFDRADLAGADFGHARLEGASFVDARLDDADLEGAAVDGATVLPRGFSLPALAVWRGPGAHPGQLALLMKEYASQAPESMDELLEDLRESAGASRLRNAMKMLKAQRFQLFSEIAGTEIVGVVRSQSTKSRVYAARLGGDGGFSCCTQNLRPCGGLRGAICKHLLVLVVGLVQGGRLDPSQAALWVAKSGLQKPTLDKEAMGEVLLRYKGAEAGELDWRPTETTPEDFYAY